MNQIRTHISDPEKLNGERLKKLYMNTNVVRDDL